MLKHRRTCAPRRRADQRGMVLIVALVVLVAITIAGAAMMRSVDTSTLVSGNLAFRQAATHSADKGIEQALAMLRQKQADGTLVNDDASNGYFASRGSAHNPRPDQSWQEFWQATLHALARDAGEDQFKNHLYYVVHRECAAAGMPGNGAFCVASPANTESTHSSLGIGAVNPKAATSVYYRITVRVVGPRRTESYVQSYVAM